MKTKPKTVAFDLLVHLRNGGKQAATCTGSGDSMGDKFHDAQRKMAAEFPDAAWIQVKGMREVEGPSVELVAAFELWESFGLDVRGEG